MPLRDLLVHIARDDPAVASRAAAATRFAPASLRPYVLAALLDGVPGAPGHHGAASSSRPTTARRATSPPTCRLARAAPGALLPQPRRHLRVAPDPAAAPRRPARRARSTRCWPTPTPRGSGRRPVVVVSAVALSEKVPDPALRPHSFELRVGELLDLDECSQSSSQRGYERVDQVEDRGQFAVRGGLLDVYPATEERAVRVDLFDIEIESLRWFSTFTQRSLGSPDAVEIAPAAELAPVTAWRRRPRSSARRGPPGHRRAAARRALRRVPRPRPRRDAVLIAAEEELGPALATTGTTSARRSTTPTPTTSTSRPSRSSARSTARAHVRLHSRHRRSAIEFRAQAAGIVARSLAEAEPELEKLVRSGYRTVVTWPRRGEGERAAYNLARLTAGWIERGRRGRAAEASASPT